MEGNLMLYSFANLSTLQLCRGMTKYRVDRIITGAYAGPLAKRHCTALRHAINYRQVAGDAGVQAVGADVLFECPRCLGRRDNG